MPTRTKDYFKRSAYVFTGYIIGNECRSTQPWRRKNIDGKDILIPRMITKTVVAVEDVWKGDVTPNITLLHTGSKCMPQLKTAETDPTSSKNKRYLIYAASNEDGSLKTSEWPDPCGSTKLLIEGSYRYEELIKSLGKPRKITSK